MSAKGKSRLCRSCRLFSEWKRECSPNVMPPCQAYCGYRIKPDLRKARWAMARISSKMQERISNANFLRFHGDDLIYSNGGIDRKRV